MLEEVVMRALKTGASDIHISAGDRPCYRVKGDMIRDERIDPLDREETKRFFNEIKDVLRKKEIDLVHYVDKELQAHGHVGFSIIVCNRRFRGNVARHNGGFYIVMRALESEPLDLDKLGFDERGMGGIEYCLSRSSGIFLVTGATGSGKTTTLAAMIKEINKKEPKNIITLEDPIEYEHTPILSHVVQKEKGVDFYDFNEALRSVLREDPDVVLVGELRDRETLDLALELAETGHLVFATLHTQSVVNTIGRIVSMSEHKSLVRDKIANSLIGVLSQKLFKDTKNTRRVLWELMVMDKASANMVREGNEHQIGGLLDNMDHSNSFNKRIEIYYAQGLMDKQTAMRLSPDTKNLRLDTAGDSSNGGMKAGSGFEKGTLRF